MAELVERSVLRTRDLVSEATAGVLQRPGRSFLTMLGTVLGIGAFVAILGFTATATGQVDKRFTALSATEVTVQDIGDPDDPDAPFSFPANASSLIESLNGAEYAGVAWALPLNNPQVAAAPLPATAAGDGDQLGLIAADPGFLQAIQPSMLTGRTFDGFIESRAEPVAVLGAAAAAELGIERLDAQPAVFINGAPYTVVGIIGDVQRHPDLLLSVIIPSSTALIAYGPPTDDRASMLIQTQLGAAPLIASQAALRLRPDAPDLLRVIPPPNPQRLRGNVTEDLNTFFLLLAGLSLIVGAVGIANTTLVAVLERSAEIGLRRALGARPRHVAAQFLFEASSLGLIGGLIGTSVAVAAVVIVAMANHWTAVLEPLYVLPAPLLGALVGLLAGIYPAMRAASLEPVEALRR